MENANVPAFHLIDIDTPIKVNTAIDQGDIYVGKARLASQTQVQSEE